MRVWRGFQKCGVFNLFLANEAPFPTVSNTPNQNSITSNLKNKIPNLLDSYAGKIEERDRERENEQER